MMGKQSGQIQMVILDIDSMIPDNHLLRQIKNCVNFDFIYEKAAPYYSNTGRKSIDPVILIKMLLIGYLYGIKSERRLEEEVSLNLAYRWFCGIDLMHKVPDHSTFSQNRKRRFKDAGIFRDIFIEIVLKCIELGLVSGETGVADGSFLPSNVSWNSRYEAVETVNRSTIKYMAELEEELASMPGYRKPENEETEKKEKIEDAITLSESMNINQGKLVMGIDIDYNKPDSKYAMCLYNVILGESATSKLFQNVREKASLAYTARSNYVRQKNNIFIRCGIEIENYDEAVKIIKEQLEEMKNGEFTEEDIENSKKYMISGIKTVADEQDSEMTYYFGQELSGKLTNFEEYIDKINAVTKEQIQEIANSISINTIYFLRN